MSDHTAVDFDWNDKLQHQGTWDRMKGKVREEWGDLTDQGLEQARGNWEQFVGYLKQKTGETADTIETKFREWF